MSRTQSTKLLERYLQAVRYLLPDREQDDIIRELRENLLSQIDDREEERGRPLTDEEVSEVLRRHGHPVLVAGRYSSRRHLIGPTFLPLYWLSLKLGLGVAAIVTAILAGVSIAMHGEPVQQLVVAMLAYPGRALQVFAWTTLGFALLDYTFTYAKAGTGWDPQSLPKLVAPEDLLSRTKGFCELAAVLVASIWLLLIPGNPWLALGPAAALVDAAPVWASAYPAMLLLMAGSAVLAAVNFIRPYWTPLRSIARIVLQAGSFALFAYLLQAKEWLIAKAGTLPTGAENVAGFLQLANGMCTLWLSIACVIAVVELVREVFRWRTRRRSMLARNATSTPAIQ